MEILPSMVSTQPKVYISNCPPEHSVDGSHSTSPLPFMPSSTSPASATAQPLPPYKNHLFSKTMSMTSEQSFKTFAQLNATGSSNSIAQFWHGQAESITQASPKEKVSLFLCRPLAESNSSVFEDEKNQVQSIDQVQQIMSYLHLDETDS